MATLLMFGKLEQIKCKAMHRTTGKYILLNVMAATTEFF